ncbi:MAG: hypothetical protein IT178_00120 [Acidobacteria bacterium]|nr:hypothetical protein [Acidobacteriota bacterium]
MSERMVELLRQGHIQTVFDLAMSRLFVTAAALTPESGLADHAALRLGRVSADVVSAEAAAGIPVEDLQFEPIGILAQLDRSAAEALSRGLAVSTIRDLALWPPFQAARRILTRVLNPAGDPVADAEAPAELVPTANQFPTERITYQAYFLIDAPSDQQTLELEKHGPIALDAAGRLFTRPATGAMLTFSQSWFPIGLSLGQLLYSLPLAPGESTKLAVIDWRRRTAASLDESVSQTESLANTLTQNRAIAEVVNTVASEVQSGRSTIDSTATAASTGLAGGALLGGPALVGGTASLSSNTSSTTGVFSSQGRREIAASMQQHISDSTHQQAFASRNRHASTVSEAVAEERESISTRSVTNYNHMHALTVQYYEVVQMYRTELKTERARRLLFIPFEPLDFTDERIILRFRGALLAGTVDPYVRDLLLQATGVAAVSLDLPRFLPFEPDPNESKKDQLKAAKAYAKDRAIARAKLKVAFNLARRRAGIVRTHDDDLTSWEMPGDVTLVDLGWDTDPGRVQKLQVRLESGNRIDVTENGFGRGGQVVNGDLPAAIPLREIASIHVEFSQADTAAHQRLRLVFRAGSARFPLPCDAVLPAKSTTARLLRVSPPVPMSELSHLLKDQTLLYSQVVWLHADPNDLIMQLGHLTFEGQPVTQYIEPRPVTTLGNAVGFIWNHEDVPAWKAWAAEHAAARPAHDLVPLPTDGVFAEAVLGRFNAAEKLDLSRFWNWQDSPIPIQAPDIAAIQAGQRDGAAPVSAGSLDGSVVNIMSPRDLPAPTGLGAALTAVASANMFRDMSGAAQLAAINQAALQAASAGATSAGAQAGANMATFAEMSVETLKAVLPLIAGALGIPMIPAPGGTNISNAGAVANEAAKIDAQQSATGGGSPSAIGGGGTGTGGAGGSGGIGTGGQSTSTGGSSSATASGTGAGGASRGSNREDVVRRTANLPPREPQIPDLRDAVFNFIFRDPRGVPIHGRFDLTLRKDGLSVDSQSVSRDAPFIRADAEFVDGFHAEEVILQNIPGPLIVTVAGEPVLGDAVGKVLTGTDAIALPAGFTTFTFSITMGSESIEVTATSEEEARRALTGGVEVTIAGEPDEVPSGGGRRKPKLSRRPKLASRVLAALSSLIDISVKGTGTITDDTTTTTGQQFVFTCLIPTGGVKTELDRTPGISG